MKRVLGKISVHGLGLAFQAHRRDLTLDSVLSHFMFPEGLAKKCQLPFKRAQQCARTGRDLALLLGRDTSFYLKWSRCGYLHGDR